MWYFVLGVCAPSIFNLIHLIVGIYLVTQRGNLSSLAWTACGFITKTLFMLWLTWLGVGYFELDFRIYVPMLSFFWFGSHVAEGLLIQQLMKQNESEYIKRIQLK